MSLAAVVVYAVYSIGLSSAAPGDPLPAPKPAATSHVRATDARVRQWLDAGASQSSTFRGLLTRLAESDVIVYLRTVDRIPGGGAGQLSFMAATDTIRYVRIDLVPDGDFGEMVALVGHELQHAVEISHVACVRDAKSMAMLYLGMGDTRISRGHYDSVAARTTEERIRLELAGHSTARVPLAPAVEKTAQWKAEKD